jgi:holliday junction DNA helicase RuvA
MISHISGELVHKEPFRLTIEASGVGYEILCTQAAYNDAPLAGNTYRVFTRLIVREDSHTLYGFRSTEERAIFDEVISVSGIGPKTGLTIVSALGANELKEAIRTGDLIALKGIPGVGKKTAERLIVELRDKLLKDEFTPESISTGNNDSASIRHEALSALMALGYSRADGEKAIRNVIKNDAEAAKKVDTLLKAALRSF